MAQALPDEIMSHWYHLIEFFQASPLAFYKSVEATIERRQVPDIRIERVDFKEGGVLAAKREYLRIVRGKYAVDVCGAPFGTGFFISTWLSQNPVLSRLQKILIMTGLFVLLSICMSRSFFGGPFVFAIIVFLALLVFLGLEESSFDDAILELPGIGWFYGRFFKPVTYYSIDTALMFQQSVHNAVLEATDQLTAAQGVRALAENERKPVLREFTRK